MGFATAFCERLKLTDEVGELLTSTWSRATQAWPQIAVDEAAFASHVAALVETEPAPVSALAGLAITELYLAFACAAGDPSALAAFETMFLSQTKPALRKTGLSSEQIDETLQRVREELLVADDRHPPRILKYGGRGALISWLRSVSVRAGLHLVKKSGRYEPIADDHAGLAAGPELLYMKKKYGDVFEAAFKSALDELTPDDRLLLKQRFKYQMGVVDLGTLYGVNPSTISRRVQTARSMLATRTRTAMMRVLDVAASDIDSILRLIESRLDITLSSV